MNIHPGMCSMQCASVAKEHGILEAPWCPREIGTDRQTDRQIQRYFTIIIPFVI